MKQFFLVFSLMLLGFSLAAQHKHNSAIYILGDVSPGLMQTNDPEESLDTLSLIKAYIETNAAEKIIVITCKVPIEKVEISLHDRAGIFKEHIQQGKMNQPVYELRFGFPESDLPKIGDILRVKLDNYTHYFSFIKI